MGRSFPGKPVKGFPTCLSRSCPVGRAAPSPGSTLHPHLGSSSLSECMNCTRLSDMSERLITLEAKVRRAGAPGPGELAVGRVRQPPAGCGWGNPRLRRPSRPVQPSPTDWVLLGPMWLWVAFSKLCQPPGVGEGSGKNKKSEGPRSGHRLVWVQALGAGRLDAQTLTPQEKEVLSPNLALPPAVWHGAGHRRTSSSQPSACLYQEEEQVTPEALEGPDKG